MARSKKPYPGMGAFVLILDYDGDWVPHKGAMTEAPLRAERRRLSQWPDSKVKIVPNVPVCDPTRYGKKGVMRCPKGCVTECAEAREAKPIHECGGDVPAFHGPHAGPGGGYIGMTTADRARREALDAGDDPALADEIAALVADQCDELGCS